jgi:hypothetical protein
MNFTIINCFSQNLEMIGKKKDFFKINGGISANQILYASSDTISRRNPYSYYLMGNLNISLYEWSIPLSFTYSNQNYSFQQPFNQYCLHPHYKWITANIGYTSASYSSYTVSGHSLLGASVDLSPKGSFKISALFGRLKRAIPFDTSHTKKIIPSFERWGYGFKTSYNAITLDNYNLNVELILFHAKDKIKQSIYIPDSVDVPKENLVIGTNASLILYKKLNLKIEFARSGITKNLLSEEKCSDKRIMTKLSPVFHANNSTSFYNSLKLATSYSGDFYSLGIAYERVDPEYQTLGAYYFNNDLENITLNGDLKILNDKVTLSGNIGKQKDNINNHKISEFDRWVSSVNISVSPNEKLNVSMNYSNFKSYTNIRSQFEKINQLTPYENLDTLNFTQLSQNAFFNVNYALSNNEKQRQNMNFNINYQVTDDQHGNNSDKANSKFFNFNSAYCYSYIPINLSIIAAINGNFNLSKDFSNAVIGPTISGNSVFFDKKLRSSLSFSINNSYLNKKLNTRIWNIRLMNSWTIMKKHNFNLSLITMNRKLIDKDKTNKYIEFTATLGYSFNF